MNNRGAASSQNSSCNGLQDSHARGLGKKTLETF